jgi:hypothetical protein
MGLLQHAALHAQKQHIIWQHFFMSIQTTFVSLSLSKGKALQGLDARDSKR